MWQLEKRSQARKSAPVVSCVVWKRGSIRSLPVAQSSDRLIYQEYHSVCPLVGIRTPPPSLTLASVLTPPPPKPKGGDTHSRVRGGGVPIRTTREKA